MALSSCLFRRPPQLRINCCSRLPSRDSHVTAGTTLGRNFLRGSATTTTGVVLGGPKNVRSRTASTAVHASWVEPSSQIASSAFTWGTLAVLPFYGFMVMAPQAELTKKVTASNVPYVLLGTLYVYLLCLSWTPDTIHLIFASKYWLPELPGIATLFSSDMTLASAWIHWLAVDLFTARQVYLEGLNESVETRHSVLLCMLCCPIGILVHVFTKATFSCQTCPDKTDTHHDVH